MFLFNFQLALSPGLCLTGTIYSDPTEGVRYCVHRFDFPLLRSAAQGMCLDVANGDIGRLVHIKTEDKFNAIKDIAEDW